MAVILLDVEGEYTFPHESISDPRMLAALAERGLSPSCIPADRMPLDSPPSWRTLLGKLARLARLGVFDQDERAGVPPVYKRLLRLGQVSVLDRSDTGMSELSNIVIADLLRGVQGAQAEACGEYEAAKATDAAAAEPSRALAIIAEAHEFRGRSGSSGGRSASGRSPGSPSAGASVGSGWAS